MKFQKGSRVEVMNKTELPTSWCVAEIISGNGHTYSLRYDCYPGVEKVSREFIRPCPPPPRAKSLQTWVAGDIVEVFDNNNNSWKTATVCKVLDGGHFSVRLHGFTHEINVHKSNVRVRESWQNGQWIPIVKISGNYEDVNGNQIVEPHCDAKICHENDNCLVVYNDAGLHESRVVSSKTPKRASPFCSSHLEPSPAKPKKLKVTEKENQRLIPNPSLEKVDSFPCPRQTLGGKTIPTPFHNTAINDDSDNDQVSVGSCSISNDGQNKWSSPYVPVTRHDTDTFSSNAASFSSSGDEDGDGDCIHRLELHAYCSTLEALYASGPLSWEKEALLTNLRISLHISNDEHLRELRHLISTGAGFLD